MEQRAYIVQCVEKKKPRVQILTLSIEYTPANSNDLQFVTAIILNLYKRIVSNLEQGSVYSMYLLSLSPQCELVTVILVSWYQSYDLEFIHKLRTTN